MEFKPLKLDIFNMKTFNRKKHNAWEKKLKQIKDSGDVLKMNQALSTFGKIYLGL
jgi:type III secretory pathway component EscU